jgi:hypothetical protein
VVAAAAVVVVAAKNTDARGPIAPASLKHPNVAHTACVGRNFRSYRSGLVRANSIKGALLI